MAIGRREIVGELQFPSIPNARACSIAPAHALCRVAPSARMTFSPSDPQTSQMSPRVTSRNATSPID